MSNESSSAIVAFRVTLLSLVGSELAVIDNSTATEIVSSLVGLTVGRSVGSGKVGLRVGRGDGSSEGRKVGWLLGLIVG